MDSVKKARILSLHMKIEELNASVRAFNALQTPTLRQKFWRWILEKRKARVMRTLRNLLKEPDNVPEDMENFQQLFEFFKCRSRSELC